MNGIHDMGGMHGFGRIERQENEPAFHHPWEGRVFAIQVATPIPIPGGFRYAIERMDAARYLTSSYYEKWLHARIQGLIEAGVFTPEELDTRVNFHRDHPDVLLPRREDPELVRRVVAQIRAAQPGRLQADVSPAFHVGEAVRARDMHPPGHTRLPRYARGKRGVVVMFHGVHPFQDTMPPGVEAPPQPLYSVRFEAEELWGESAEPNAAVYLDMWESYLEPA